MQFLYAFAALLCVGAVAAQNTTTAPAQAHPNQALIDRLLKNGETLLSHARELVGALVQQNKGHLVQAIEHELIFVEALVLELRDASKHVTNQNIHQLHVIEEELLHRENRVAEELEIIITRVVPNTHAPQTAAELIARGEKLVADARAELKVLTHTREHRTIENELFQVERLLADVKAHPTAASTLAVEQLARHEQTLAALLARAKAQPAL